MFILHSRTLPYTPILGALLYTRRHHTLDLPQVHFSFLVTSHAKRITLGFPLTCSLAQATPGSRTAHSKGVVFLMLQKLLSQRCLSAHFFTTNQLRHDHETHSEQPTPPTLRSKKKKHQNSCLSQCSPPSSAGS